MSTDERAARLAARLVDEETARRAAEAAGDTRAAKHHAAVSDQLVDEALAPDLRFVVRAWRQHLPVGVGADA